MLKKILLAAAVTISSFAQVQNETDQPKSLDLKILIQESIDEIEKNQNIKAGGWLIQDRNKSNTGESFITILAAPKMDTNLSTQSNITANETYEKYKDLEGLGFLNDINYSKNSFNTTSTLVSLPQNTTIGKKEDLLIKKILNDKIIVINSNYNLNDYRYLVSLKDINISIPDELNIETKNIQINGYYDQYNLTKQESKFSIDSIEIKPLAVDLLGEYIKMKNFQIRSETEKNEENLNLNYTIFMDVLDMNVDKEHSKIEKLNLSMTIGNLNLKAYEDLVNFLQENTENLEESEELQILILELFARSKDIYIELSDLSLLNVAIEGEEMGPVKITTKVSLKSTRELIQMIAVTPEAALTALSMETRVEFPKTVLKEIYKQDNSVGALAILFAKDQNGTTVYDATYKEGQLIINDQLFTQNTLQNLHNPKSTPQVTSTPSHLKEKQPEFDALTKEESNKKENNTSNLTKETPQVNQDHAKKYEQNTLHQAVLSKNQDEVKKILENDASDINFADKLGRTPLHYAVFNGDMESTKLLLDKGADINAVDKAKQWTPLFFAVFMKHENIVDLLIKKGADQTLKDKFNRTIDQYRK